MTISVAGYLPEESITYVDTFVELFEPADSVGSVRICKPVYFATARVPNGWLITPFRGDFGKRPPGVLEFIPERGGGGPPWMPPEE